MQVSMAIKKQNFPFYTILILLLVAIIAYWPIAFMNNSLKWDMIDVVLPFRYFAGECWNHGILPLWNPYQQMGYPVYADMQCPAWYPETILIGLLGGYTNYSLHVLFIFYLVVGGWGVYKLANHFGAEQKASLISAIAFMCSGFFVGHAQALFAIISAVWIPYILLNYFRFNENGKIQDVIKASVFMFLLISNGYQTFTIILFYILLLILTYSFFKTLILRNWKKIKILISLNLLFLIFTLILSLVSVVSSFQVAEHLDRAGGVSLQSALINPLTPQSLISLLIPFSTVKNPEFFNTDLSMANVYIGLIVLIFAISFLLKRNKLEFYLIRLIPIICLLASFGDFLPVREYLYEHVPFMNLFRFPSYFSYFTQLAFFLFAALGISHFIKKPATERIKLQWLGFPVLAGLLSLFILSLFKIDLQTFSFRHFPSDFHETLAKSGFFEHIFLQAFIQIIILSVFIIFLRSGSKLMLKWIILLIVMDMIVSVQLNVFYTGVSHKKPKALKEQIEKLPGGFPIPSGKIIKQNDGSRVFLPVWRNTGIFYKEIHYDGFSSFWLNNYVELFNNYPNLSTAILNNELVYLSDQLFPYDSLSDSSIRLKDHLHLHFKNATELKTDSFKLFPDDTVHITNFSPNKIELKTQTNNKVLLTLLQSNYPGWEVRVDGVQKEIIPSNILYMSVVIPSGQHKVVFKYRNPVVKASFFISYSFLLLLLIILTWMTIMNQKVGRNDF